MIKLTDITSIEPYPYGWILYTKRKSVTRKAKGGGKAGEETEVTDESYHGTLQQALKSSVDETLKNCKSAKEIISLLETLNKKIDKIEIK